MKLKKIASLLLAGVMVVSMLAGCSSSSSSSDDVTTDVDEEAATTYSSTLYGYLSNNTAKNNLSAVESTALTTALDNAVGLLGGKCDYTKAGSTFTWAPYTFDTYGSYIESYVMDQMGATYTLDKLSAPWSRGSGIVNYNESFVALSVGVIGAGVSDGYALELAAAEINSYLTGLKYTDSGYNRDYTISASIVSSTDANGVSVKFVAVMVSATITGV